jgi:hypothetical protein
VPLQYGLRRDVSFLQVDAPISEFFERNRQAGDRATHESAGSYDAEIAVEIFDLGLAGHRGWAIGTIEQLHLRRRSDYLPPASGNIMALRQGRNTRFAIERRSICQRARLVLLKRRAVPTAVGTA